MQCIARLRCCDSCIVEVGSERRVKAIDHVAQAHGQTDVDELLGREVSGEIAVEPIIDGIKLRRLLRIAHDCCFRRCVNALGEWVIRQMAQLLLCKTQAPTEHRVGWDSVETVVDRGRRDVRQLAVLTV